MHWQYPNALYLLWIVPVWIGLQVYARARRARAGRAFVEAAMEDRILPHTSSARFWIRTGLSVLALVFAILALSRPRFGVYFEEVRKRGSDLYVLLDVSKSMLAADVPPNRLDRAKSDIKVLLKRMKGERVGLIAFAGKPVVKCPLTTDLGFFRLALDDVDVYSAPRGGTAVGDAIRKALEVMPKEGRRDQAILLITDGEDHDSYPLDAAKAAAERHVMIFTVGLGDPSHGARIPGKTSGTFVRHEGKQVWSKLDETTLQEIALLTNGAYLPARTASYDLGTLYADRLSKLRGEMATEQKRKRLHEQYQIFLGLSLACLLVSLFVRPYSQRQRREPFGGSEEGDVEGESRGPIRARSKPVSSVSTAVLFVASLLTSCAHLPSSDAWAGEATGSSRDEEDKQQKAKKENAIPKPEPEEKTEVEIASENKGRDATTLVDEGLDRYRDQKYDEARKKFMAADVARPETPLIAFDLGCAYHRKGDKDRAEEQYRRAGLAKDKRVSVAARYNLGLAEAEAIRKRVGENPETVPPDQREEIIEGLMRAVGYFRQCIENNPRHKRARHNLELIRQWIKYYTEKWRKKDREERRQQMDLVKFLEYLMQTQELLRATTRALGKESDAKFSDYFDLKTKQEELVEEIPVLKDKIDEVARKMQPPQGQPGPQPTPPKAPAKDQIEKEIKQLKDWADESGKQMEEAVRKLDARESDPAVTAQEAAHEKLDHIWMSVVPFGPILSKALAQQTLIAGQLEPPKEDGDEKEKPKGPVPPPPEDETKDEMNAELARLQARTGRYTALLPPKAKQMLEQLKKMPAQAQPAPGQGPQPQPGMPPGHDPNKMKKALEKAIELAPKALEHEKKAHEHLKTGKRTLAHPEAEEARKILEEIAKEMPKDKKKQDQKKDQKNQQKQKPEPKKDEKKEQQKQKRKRQKDLSKQQAEALLRRVREREKERRKKLEKIRRQMVPPSEVDRDW